MTEREPVVLLHGMWSTPDTLSDLASYFKNRGHEVLVPRLPLHHPKSKLTPAEVNELGQLGLADYVVKIRSDIDNFMKEHPNVKPIIVGHSMGGLLAQLLAGQLECAKLVLLSSAPPAGMNGWSWSVIRTFGHNLFKFPLWRTHTHLLLRNIQYGVANSQSSSVHKELIQNATYESGRVSTQIGMWFLYLNPPSRVEFVNIKCPVLIIGGNKDKLTPIKLQRKIAKRLGNNATLKVIEGACHYTVGGTFFNEVCDKIQTWLDFHQQSASLEKNEKNKNAA